MVIGLTDAEVAPAVAHGVGADTPGDVPVDASLAVALDVTPDGLAALRDDARVTSVLTRGTTVTTALARSVPLVGAPALWSDGHTGAGRVIVVIDTGVDADFGGALVGQACFAASAAPGGGSIGHCGPAADQEQAFSPTCFDLGVCDAANPYYVADPEAGRPCPAPPVGKPYCAHGSAVAAVAARHTAPQGVAPDAGVYAIRVFNPSGTSADLIDIFLALDHVVQLADAGLEVAAVNLSVATLTRFSGACDADPSLGGAPAAYAGLLSELRDRGIAVVAASGNDGAAGQIAFPACLSGAVAVGATELDDDVAPFSNTGPAIDLLAPGAGVGSGPADVLDIPSGTGFSQWAGTSFAAPHVAGAFALLEDQYPKASVAQLVSFLRDTGVPVACATHRPSSGWRSSRPLTR